MHEHMNDSANRKQNASTQQAQSAGNPGKTTAGDYIDFEEIK